MKAELTQYGFRYGGATIERWCSDDDKGWVVCGLKTKRYPNGIQIFITKTGKVRVWDGGIEWKPIDGK